MIKIKKKLPKLYRVVEIEFSSLRNGLGSGLGVIFDIDTMVKRHVRRVLGPSGWCWQIKDLHQLREWDYFVDTDQEVLNEIGEDAEEIILTSK